jgi:virulence-associated protein VagC
MKTTTVFKSGNSLVVRLPAGFTLPIGRVEIQQERGGIFLRVPKNHWPENFFDIFAASSATDDWQRPIQGENFKTQSW